ncbi:MAG: hypothetical protein FWD53_02130 [Phycisphaerales bacterium]|nr:hypothetical protein [Phycisphaerales bacterium]
MILKSEREVVNTRNKLRKLQEMYRTLQMRRDEDAYIKQVGLQSLKRLIVQLQEEILRYEARQVERRELARR